MARGLYVLLGDVQRSRSVEDREGFRLRLEAACDDLNAEHAESLRAGFGILKGIDEIGAVLSTMSGVYDIVDTLQERVSPKQMRVVVARGEVDTALESGQVGRMDGPAFHAAARLMAELKESKLLFAMAVGDDVLDDAVSGMVNLLLMTKAGRSARHREVIVEYEKSGSQVDAAESLGVSQQAVSSALVRSKYREVRLLEAQLAGVFANFERRLSGGGADRGE